VSVKGDPDRNKWARLPAILSEYGVDLTLRAYQERLNPLVRNTLYENRILQILARRRKNTPILLGNNVGFLRAVIEGAAIQLTSSPQEAVLSHMHIVYLELDKLLSSDKPRNIFQNIIEEIKAEKQRMVLCIHNIETMINYPDKDLFDVDFRRAALYMNRFSLWSLRPPRLCGSIFVFGCDVIS
jgi:ATP-dependent Clp protease ATP-binding subunit ClpA